MTRLEVGQNTPVFLKWKSKHASAESRSLSIIYPDPANLGTRNFMYAIIALYYILLILSLPHIIS